MNAGNATATNTVKTSVNALMGSAKFFVGLVFLIAVLVGLYYLYTFLFRSSASFNSVPILSGTKETNKEEKIAINAPDKAVAVTEITGVTDGGEYSVNFWVYIADTKDFKGSPTPLAHLLEITDRRFDTTKKGNTLVFVGLNPNNAGLIVRQSTLDPQESIDNSITSEDITGTRYPLTSLINEYNASSFYSADDRCDITNGIEYQRWVQITVVGNGRTLDVYIDGKLARSCVYRANYAIKSDSGKAIAYFGLNNEGKLRGYFSDGTFYNSALTPEKIWSLYQSGPGTHRGFADFFKNMFATNVTFDVSM